MNKILVDGDKLLLSKEITDITINGICKIYINNLKDNINLNIKLNDKAEVNIYDFNKSNKNVNILIEQTNNTTLNYYHTFEIDGEYNFKLLSNISGNNNKNNINIMGVSLGNSIFDIDGIALKNTSNNELNENIKILNIDGFAKVLPKLHINTKDVIANHNTAISNIREDELFYLMSKGIEKSKACDLIKEGYVYNYFKGLDEEFYNLIK